MTMSVSRITTYLRPEDAHTLIEFLDQLRDMLIKRVSRRAVSTVLVPLKTPHKDAA